MSTWDYIMPHRLLINKSLRRAAQELRDRVEAYQIEFNRRLEDCKTELQQAEDNKNKELEAFRAVLLQELRDDQQMLEETQGSIVEYISCFFYRAYLYQLVDIQKKQNDILHEDYVFISSQIRLIDNEIILLRERQNELTAFTKVDDIIHLATLTGYELNFKSADDAKLLLEKISDALQTYAGEDSVEKYALLRLKAIIQERSEYLPTINYISWVIQIKRQFKKQLSLKHSSIKKEQAILRDEIFSAKSEIQNLTARLELLAKNVRYYWAKPITYLNADLCYAYIELKKEKARLREEAPVLREKRKELIDKKRSAISEIREKKTRRRDVGAELRSLSDSHSSDQWKWDSLQSESKRLTSDIDSLSSDIDHYSYEIDALSSEIESLESAVRNSQTSISLKKDTRKQWGTKKTHIVQLIKRYDKGFRSDRKIAEGDEISIITARLIEIQEIRETGIVEAQRVCSKETEEIIRLHDLKTKEHTARKAELETRLRQAEQACSSCSQRVSIAIKRLETCKRTDDRAIIFKLFSESAEVIEAKEELEKAQDAFAKAKKVKSSIVAMITELENDAASETKLFQERLENCKPQYSRPTADEQREENKLMLRQEEIKSQPNGGRL